MEAPKKAKDNVIIFYQNTRSIRRRLNQLKNNLYTFTDLPDIIILTESWLNDDIQDSEIDLPFYNIFRTDRNYKNTSSTRGGVVLIAVNNKIKSRLLQYSIISNNSEHLFIEISLKYQKWII